MILRDAECSAFQDDVSPFDHNFIIALENAAGLDVGGHFELLIGPPLSENELSVLFPGRVGHKIVSVN